METYEMTVTFKAASEEEAAQIRANLQAATVLLPSVNQVSFSVTQNLTTKEVHYHQGTNSLNDIFLKKLFE